MKEFLIVGGIGYGILLVFFTIALLFEKARLDRVWTELRRDQRDFRELKEDKRNIREVVVTFRDGSRVTVNGGVCYVERRTSSFVDILDIADNVLLTTNRHELRHIAIVRDGALSDEEAF